MNDAVLSEPALPREAGFEATRLLVWVLARVLTAALFLATFLGAAFGFVAAFFAGVFAMGFLAVVFLATAFLAGAFASTFFEGTRFAATLGLAAVLAPLEDLDTDFFAATDLVVALTALVLLAVFSCSCFLVFAEAVDCLATTVFFMAAFGDEVVALVLVALLGLALLVVNALPSFATRFDTLTLAVFA
ncbi:MAG: hypothetical protein O2949_04155 [Proteobacteria bacterium]|nr:hypothetical protein [Pseudomonadota bacterium]MDA0958503.1 hypothetical protein [Pseudomonadota bacterium]